MGTGVQAFPVGFAALWDEAESFPAFLDRVESQRSLWEGVYRTSSVPEWAATAFRALPGGLRMLVLNAAWCLDSANTVPVLARIAEAVPGVELRLLERDDYPELMDRYLTDGGRSIPLAILLDQSFRELGRWGPRPAELQAWVLASPRLGRFGYGLADVQIRLLRGQQGDALQLLREAERAGWRGPYWRYHRDFDPVLAPIRDHPEFKAVFAEIERDMAHQRAAP